MPPCNQSGNNWLYSQDIGTSLDFSKGNNWLYNQDIGTSLAKVTTGYTAKI